MRQQLPRWCRILPTGVLAIFIASTVMAVGHGGSAFADTPGVEPIPPFSTSPGPVVPGPGISPSGIGILAVTGTPVNNPALDTGLQDTQSETTAITGPGGLVVVAYNDSAAYGVVGNGLHFTGWSRSTDGGATFTDMGAPPDSGNGDCGDPVLARDEVSARIYLSTLMCNGSGLQVFRSDDGAQTWMAPVNGAPGTAGFQDKEWLTVDNFPGAGQGNVYMSWTDFGAGSAIRFTRSVDQGATFAPSPGLSLASGTVQGSFVVVSPDHSVSVFWYQVVAGVRTLQVARSTDFGATFGAAVTITSLNTVGTNGNLSLNGGLRSNSFPHAAVNPVNGNLYVVYNDCAAAACAGADHGNVFLRRSADNGATWSAPSLVNDDGTATDQFFPTVAVLPSGKQLMVSFYDRRNDTAGNLLIDRYAAVGVVNSVTGTVLFQPNTRVSGQSFPVVIGQDPVVNSTYMGDYDQIAVDATGFHVVWSDTSLANPSQFSHANQPDVRHQYVSALVDTTKPVWTATWSKWAQGPGTYTPGTWSTVYVVLTFQCTDEPGGSGIASKRGDLQVVFNDDGVWSDTDAIIGPEGSIKGDAIDEYCIDNAGNIADPIDPLTAGQTVMVDTKAPVCKPKTGAIKLKKNQTHLGVTNFVDGSDPTSGWSLLNFSAVPYGGAATANETWSALPPGATITMDVTLPNSTASGVKVFVTMFDAAGNKSTCNYTIKAK